MFPTVDRDSAIPIEVWTKSGLVTVYLLFVMELATRRVRFAGCTTNPDEFWMCQAARNLSDAEDGFLHGKKYLLMDRDTKFSEAFRVTLEQGGMEAVRLPPRSPNLRCFLTPGPMPRQRMRCVQLTIHVLATGRRTGHRAQLPHARGFPLPRSRPRFLPFFGSNRPSAA